MSIADYPTHHGSLVSLGQCSDEGDRPLNRIQQVRQRQGVSLRSVARRMHVETRRLREEEKPESDLTLSDLYRWQRALEVPAAELLDGSDEPISRPVLERARLVRLMKTAAAMYEQAEDEQIQRMAQVMRDQLIEIMPELKDVSPWHTIGQRRTLEDMGSIVGRRVPDEFFHDAG